MTSLDRPPDHPELDAAGVITRYVDGWGVEQRLSAAAAERFAASLSTPCATAPVSAAPGEDHPGLEGVLRLEDGRSVRVRGGLPADTPFGWHLLHGPAGVRRVVCAPARLRRPERGWGWSVQLYAARRHRSWGIGDLSDLAAICARTREAGGRLVVVSPLHAMAPRATQANSPYSPASRLWLNVLHVDIDAVPGADEVDLDDLRRTAQALNAERRIDRDLVWACKRAALERIWAATGRDDEAAQAWTSAHGTALRSFATWSTLAEEHEGAWWTWPSSLRHPADPAVLRFAEQHAERVAFWQWVQWVADAQLCHAAAQGVDLVVDLAVGFDAGGADAWRWQDLLAEGFEVGCPPDPRHADGQRWGLPPIDPNRSAHVDHGPFLETVRAALRHAAAVRIDHVAGLWRQWWVPADGPAADGGYVRFPGDDLAAVLRLEAHRAGSWAVGEDLGTVEDRVRRSMLASSMLGYRVWMRTEPATWPEGTLGVVTTHDQATVAGMLDGSDLAMQRRVGHATDEAKAEAVRARLAAAAGIDPSGPIGEAEVLAAIEATHREIAESASLVVTATLDDAAAVRERPNLPGTVDEYPNWRVALPRPVDEILDGTVAGCIIETFRAAGR